MQKMHIEGKAERIVAQYSGSTPIYRARCD